MVALWTQFFIKCNKSVEPPKALLQKLRILNWLGSDCYNSSGSSFRFSTWLSSGLYNISSTKNKFTAIGYDTYAFITGSASIPRGVREYDISLASYYNHSRVLSFNPCSHAFVVEEGKYEFSASHLNNSGEDWKLPMILDWTIGDQSCSEAKKDPETYACKENTICREPENGNGYLCKCGDVSRGTHTSPMVAKVMNPFSLKSFVSIAWPSNMNFLSNLSDIDECETLRPCSSTCHNKFGGFYCSCPKGYEGDGRRDGSGCSPMVNHHNWKLHITQTAIG
ncbi:hypothetical protein PVK06_005097 [Gossypium arboreum]|uniref:EGF-like domain-containing protein n=1 Tax=Gossypium arboreum TaxID=29729 RepID=A0ABR0QTQ0_GOSAR|nr:hypothetical protein PVK06_005097 [Gossypium arboreum]